MSTGEFIWFVIVNLIWPPKGIIYLEEQIYQWIYAFGKVWILHNMPALIMAAAIYFLIMFVVVERHHFHHGRGGIGRVLRFFVRMIITIALSWVMLIFGAIRGERTGGRGENNARVTTTMTYARNWFYTTTQTFTRLSLHFRLGRWLYRAFYNLLGHIAAVNNRERIHEILARSLALVVIFWGVWNIPYDLTH